MHSISSRFRFTQFSSRFKTPMSYYVIRSHAVEVGFVYRTNVHYSGTIDLSSTSQGPALTITIKQHNSNDISVDLVPSLPCSLPVTMHGWPRTNTRSAYTSKKIEAVIKAGLHLVPKGDETWTISYSKAERELLDKIDDGNECRRGVMRLLKSYLEQCKQAKASKGLPGLSSHIIKVCIRLL